MAMVAEADGPDAVETLRSQRDAAIACELLHKQAVLEREHENALLAGQLSSLKSERDQALTGEAIQRQAAADFRARVVQLEGELASLRAERDAALVSEAMQRQAAVECRARAEAAEARLLTLQREPQELYLLVGEMYGRLRGVWYRGWRALKVLARETGSFKGRRVAAVFRAFFHAARGRPEEWSRYLRDDPLCRMEEILRRAAAGGRAPRT